MKSTTSHSEIKLIINSLALLLLLSTVQLSAQIPAFPGAEGYGAASIGGRGGKVIEVSNLNDSGEGSLRAAIEQSGPRIIVFRVAGIIELESDINVYNPYLTIAGQTAPGDGICIKYKAEGQANTGITIRTHDVVIRYLRIRCGFSSAKMDFGSPFGARTNAYNVILDHCSTSWHPGRTGMTIWPETGKYAKDITIQRHLAAEALLGGDYPGGARGAFLFGSRADDSQDGYIDHITLYSNLMAHNKKRHPEAKNCQKDGSHYITTYQLINNVSYHFRIDGMLLIGNENNSATYFIPDEEVCHYNVIGNYFKRSEISSKDHSEISLTPGVKVFAGDSIYGNIGPNRSQSSMEPWDIVSFINWDYPNPDTRMLHAPTDPYQVLSPFEPENLPPYVTASEAYTSVLKDVGANKALNGDGSFRNVSDPVDVRMINDVKNNTGKFIISPADVGGWPEYKSGSGPYADTDKDGMPDDWETIHNFNSNDITDGSEDADMDGYTNVEEFLNGTDPEIDDVLAIKTVNLPQSFSVYPNPSQGSFTIAFDVYEESDFKLVLRNVLGQIIYLETLTGIPGSYSNSIDISEFGKGLYIMTLSNANDLRANNIIVL
ncbi:T9SS type A sorting domain-containing protein [Bacteroidota bacterium]